MKTARPARLDGFRVDVSYRVMKDAQFRDNIPNPNWQPGMNPFNRLTELYTQDQPENHDFNRWVRAVADEYEDKLLIGEIYLPIPDLVAHYGRHDEFHLPFNFHLIHSQWNAAAVRNLIEEYEGALPEDAWPNWVLGNHDQHRFATRVGPAQARMGMMLLLTLRGTPTVYFGDEIGMEDGHIPPDKIQDPAEINAPNLGLGRDPERTPMQWDGSPNAGFCPPEIEPWLPVADNHQQVNMALQQEQPHSILAFTRRLITLRQQSPALYDGRYHSLEANDDLLAYVREADGERCFIVLNFSSEAQTWPLPQEAATSQVLLSTHLNGNQILNVGYLHLRGHEGMIISTSAPDTRQTPPGKDP
jgi:alpha-glucosidase